MLRAVLRARIIISPGSKHQGAGRPRASPLAGRRAALVVAGATSLLGATLSCGDKGPGPVQPITCPSANVPVCTPATATAARDVTSDASSRSTPALENTTARSALGTNLGQLDAALANGNITDARAALGRVREAITAARAQLTQFPGDAADLTAIELQMDQVAPLIGTS